jgi:hypothetical protein
MADRKIVPPVRRYPVLDEQAVDDLEVAPCKPESPLRPFQVNAAQEADRHLLFLAVQIRLVRDENALGTVNMAKNLEEIRFLPFTIVRFVTFAADAQQSRFRLAVLYCSLLPEGACQFPCLETATVAVETS